jgi:hypothetical protein
MTYDNDFLETKRVSEVALSNTCQGTLFHTMKMFTSTWCPDAAIRVYTAAPNKIGVLNPTATTLNKPAEL